MTPPWEPGEPLRPLVVWGAGAMGGAIGAAWVRAGREVVFVDADVEHVAAVRRNGLTITGPVDAFRVEALAMLPDEAAAPGPDETAAEVEGASSTPGSSRRRALGTVFLCVKAHHTRDAMEAIAPLLAPDGVVVSVQNGLNEAVIADFVGVERTVGCFVNFGADVVEPGVVLRGNRGAVVVGEMDGADTPRVREIHRLLRIFEPDAVLTDNIPGYLWAKLAYGALLFATALADASIADVLASEPHRPGLIALAREVTAVADALGIELQAFDGFDPAAFAPSASDAAARGSLDRLVAFNRASAKSHSGVWRDLAVRKRRTEVDAQIAPIADHGRAVGVDTPRVRRLVGLIHDVEEGRRGQGWDALDVLVGGGASGDPSTGADVSPRPTAP